jgi:SSS family solute:Na+ symporter
MDFTLLDWLIVAVYLVTCFGAGVYCRKFVGGVEDYLVAGRALGVYLGIATLAATEIGTVTFMYYAELGYKAGFAPFITALIAGGVFLVIGRTGFIVEKLRELKLLTVPEYCQHRYSRGVRILMGLFVATGGILNMGLFLRVEGQFLTILTGIPGEYLVAVMVGILLLEMAYTVLGGMVSIAVTDFIQYVVLSTATLLISLTVIGKVGWGNLVSTVSSQFGPAGFDPIAHPEFGWTFIIWQVLTWTAGNTCWQTTAMRVFALRQPELSRRVYTWTGFIFLGRGMFPILWGIAALAVLGPGHDPVTAMPEFLHQLLGPGARGIVLAGMLAATMSVNSAYLLGWSSIISQDIIVPLRRKPLSEKAQMRVNRLANVLVSLFIMFWGLFYQPPGAVYLYLQITGTMFLAGTFISVVAGLYWRRASTLGAYAALVGGALGALGYLLLNLPANYSGFAAFGMAALGMLAGSLVLPSEPGPEEVAK